MKYISAEKLLAEIERRMTENCKLAEKVKCFGDRAVEDNDILALIDSLQQDETQVDRMLCSQIWWEEQGWIMIPPNVTIKGVDSLLKQVRKKLQQEQPEVDIKKEIDELWKSLNTGHDYVIVDSYQDFLGICLHCFELGLNARKER